MDKRTRMKNRGVALLLVMTIITGIFLIVRNAVVADDEIVLTDGDSLNGWSLDAYWANGTKIQNVHSSADENNINVKLTIEYYAPITAMTRDYAPGTVSFRVPDIGSVKRSGAPFTPVTAADSIDSIWNCEYDVETESYVFKNKSTIERNKPLSGGFEIMWTLESRKCLDDFHIVSSPVFMLENEGTRMTPLEFHATMDRDYYHINMLRSYISYQEYIDEGFKDKSFVTYNYRTDFGLQKRARADDRSSYFIKVHFEDSLGNPATTVTDELMGQIVINADHEEHLLTQITDPYTGETVWGFYRFEDRKASMLSYDNFRLSYPMAIEEMGVSAVVDSYLTVHYLDDPEDQYVTYTTQMPEENLHGRSSGMVSNYSFNYGRGNFSMYKTSDYEVYDYGQSRLNEGSAPAYAQKLLAKKVFNNERVTFTVGGNYRASTTSGATSQTRKTTSTSAGTQDEDVELTDGIDLQTKFDFVLGDDRLSVRRENASGTMTEGMVQSSEYTISRLVYPRNTDSYKPDYDYDVYISPVGYTTAADRVAKPSEYVKFGTGNTRSEKVFDFTNIANNSDFSRFEDGVKAVYVVIKNIPSYKSYGTYYYVDIRFHFDEETAKIDTGADASTQTTDTETEDTNEAHITNIGFMRAFRAGQTTNLCATKTDSFDGSFSSQIIKQDAKSYNDDFTETGSPDQYELLYHCKSNVYLRDVTTFLTSGTKVTSTARQKEDGGGHIIDIKTTGSIYAERPDDESTGEMSLFSLYVKLPSLLTIDSTLDGVSLANCTGTDLYGNPVPNSEFQNNVSFRLFTISTGERVIAADFDFSDNPLDIFSTTNLTLNIPALVTYMDLKVADSKQFEVVSYTMLRDSGVGKIKALNGETYDTYGFNGTERLEIMASSLDRTSYEMIVEEWVDTTQKLVKSFSDETWQYRYDRTLRDWISETSVHAYSPVIDTAANRRSTYSYRISADLGSTSSDLLIYDRLESEDESEWQGSLQSIDFTYVRHLNLIPTVYYSTEAKDYEETLSGDILATYTSNLNEFTQSTAAEWNAEGTLWTAPVDNIRTIVVKLGTSALNGGVIHGKQVYFVANMQAPEDDNGALLGKFAVNSHRTFYTVHSSYSNSRRSMKSMKSYVELQPAVVLVTLRKSDEKTGNVLTGAEFSFYSDDQKTPVKNWKDETVAQNLVVNSLGELVVDCLPPGKYYFEETKAPSGYRLDDTLYELDISGSVSNPIGDQTYLNNVLLDFSNERLYGKIVLTKKDADDPDVAGISGAEYMLYDAGGIVIYTNNKNEYVETDGTKSVFTTNNEGTLTITGLPWGSYYLLETKAPTGYQLNNEKIRVIIGRSINYDEQVTENAIVVRVEQKDVEQTAAVELIKYDRDGITPLPNAWFALEKKNRDGTFSQVEGYTFIKTGRDGTVTAEELKFGTYRFKEVNAPVGYVLDEATRYSPEIVLNASTVGTVRTATMKNERILGSATLKKVSDDGLPLNGAVFNLYMVNGEIDDTTNVGDPEDVAIRLGLKTETNTETGESGWLPVVTGLDWGRYYFKEFSSPSGYDKDERIYPFEINASNAAIVFDTLKYENNRKKGAVVLTKTAGETVGSFTAGTPLEDAEFVLCTSEGERLYVIPDPEQSGAKGYYSLATAETTGAIQVMKTDENGQIHLNQLDWNAYYLEETKAPSGFALCEKVRFTVNSKSCLSEQELESEDLAMKCLIRIDKLINAKLDVFGTPTFLFKITNTDNGKTFLRSITLKGDALTGSVTAQVQAGNYRVEEIPVIRYKLTNTRYILPDSTATERRIDGVLTDERENGKVFTFTLGSTDNIPHEAHIEFTNTLEDYTGLSHTDAVLNIVPSRRKLTGFSLNLKDEYIECLRIEHAETLHEVTLDDLTGVLTYDDGSEEAMTPEQLAAIVKTGDWTIDNGFANAGQSFPLSAQYTGEGKTYKTTFFATVGPYKIVESQKVIFRNDIDNSTTFPINGKQSSVNVVYYNDDTAGNEKIAVSGEYISPQILADMGMVTAWEIIGGEHNGETLAPNESAVKEYLKNEYDNGLRQLELRAVVARNVFDFEQRNQVQEFIAPKDGIYFLEGWGAQGGNNGVDETSGIPEDELNIAGLRNDIKEHYSAKGGAGGYSYGYVYLKEGEKVYIATGGAGTTAYNVNNTYVVTSAPGGFNGGADAHAPAVVEVNATPRYFYGSGGGATHFALSMVGNGLLSDYSSNREQVLLVAGGGGGNGQYSYISNHSWNQYGKGGFGGGEVGGSVTNCNHDNAALSPTNTGGGQNAGGAYGSLSGQFGKGVSGNLDFSAGGGGGWYGGVAVDRFGGSGGSGHVGEKLITGATIGGDQTFKSPDGSLETGHSGGGYARITYIANGEMNLGYSGKAQKFTAPISGYYKLEGWGAAGGGSMRLDYEVPAVAANNLGDAAYQNKYEVEGGRGGYSSGYIYLAQGQSIYYAVGAKGNSYYQPKGQQAPLHAEDAEGNSYGNGVESTVDSPFNGGGTAIVNDGHGYAYLASGGGATHFALNLTNNGVLSDYVNNKNDVLMVAGGGGGSSTYLNTRTWYCYFGRGGSGGGTESQGNYDAYTTRPNHGYTVSGSTQTGSDTTNRNFNHGSFGQGGQGTGGGGGGYWGGTSSGGSGGAGGSGYINSSYLSDARNVNGVFHDSVYDDKSYTIETGSYTTSTGEVITEESIPTHEFAIVDNGIVGISSHDTLMIGNRGDGYARITYIPFTEAIDYTYTEKVQPFTAPVTGYYKLEAWGASGGDADQTDKPEYGFQKGGRGGYSYGTVYLKAGETIYVAVGGEGAAERVTVGNRILPGGFNGGGATHAGNADTYKMVAAGGGATHFAYALNSGSGGVLSDYSAENDQSKVLLVAGGGGGALYCRYNTTNGWFVAYGGYGGGEKGGDGEVIASGRTEFIGFIPGGEQQLQSENPAKYKYGTFGKGADADSKTGDSGGGGGWYGGAKYAYQNGVIGGMSGGGGSGHCNSDKLLDEYGYDTIGGNQTFNAPDGTQETGHTGNGYARVSFVGAPDSQEFEYTGSVQTFTVQKSGKYLFEAWGAEGGCETSSNLGGNGGYTSGEIMLYQGTTIYVYVGQKPDAKFTQQNEQNFGGFNGGGDTYHVWSQSGSGGGGATDFRLVSSTAADGWSGFDSLKSRIMVAGGGGGGSDQGWRVYYYQSPTVGESVSEPVRGELGTYLQYSCTNGGAGGGLVGKNATQYDSYGATGGSQTIGGIVTNERNVGHRGQFGIGGGYNLGNIGRFGCNGGGGGYYGGGASVRQHGGGGGGSSFVSGYEGCDAIDINSTEGNLIHTSQPNHYSGYVFTSGVIKAGDEAMPTHDGSDTMTGNTGNGYAKITFLG